jgi:hypothetical protein
MADGAVVCWVETKYKSEKHLDFPPWRMRSLGKSEERVVMVED